MKVNEKKVNNALKHKDKLWAWAKKRKMLNPMEKVAATMKEFTKWTLHSWSWAKVTDRKQALAIWFSEARAAKAWKKWKKKK